MAHVTGEQQQDEVGQEFEPETTVEDGCEVWGGNEPDNLHPEEEDDALIGGHGHEGNEEEEGMDGDMEGDIDFNALLIRPDDGNPSSPCPWLFVCFVNVFYWQNILME